MDKKLTKYIIVLIINIVFAFLFSFIFSADLSNKYIYKIGYGIAIILVEMPILALFIYSDHQRNKNNTK